VQIVKCLAHGTGRRHLRQGLIQPDPDFIEYEFGMALPVGGRCFTARIGIVGSGGSRIDRAKILAMSNKPLVSVLTPVYNGGAYLSEAIESVLRQPYDHWEYVIVNNCSTDNSLAIAESYARADSRIRVVTNDEFVDCESNHNNAFRQISPESNYCKIVSADDWLLPGALSRFVEFAVEHPSAGIIGSYQQSGSTIRWKGVPADVELLSGRDACRLSLLDEIHVFGTPTSILYRSDLVRRDPSFYPHIRPHADTSACFASLSSCDFGFIHEVLTVERVHEARVSSDVEFLDAGSLAMLETILTYGPTYLSESEMDKRLEDIEATYYRCVARGLLKLKGRRFLRFHKAEMQRLGLRLDNRRIARGALDLLVTEMLNPITALRKLRVAIASRSAPGSASS